MDFLTLHELSVQLDVSVRVLRHRLRQLLTEGKLVENRDCRRDDYVDPTHFVWRVDPAVFIRAPLVEQVDAGVEVLAKLEDGKIVAARQGRLLAAAFHPELTDDSRFHRYFLDIIDGHR